jgi:hypothetical protein
MHVKNIGHRMFIVNKNLRAKERHLHPGKTMQINEDNKAELAKIVKMHENEVIVIDETVEKPKIKTEKK